MTVFRNLFLSFFLIANWLPHYAQDHPGEFYKHFKGEFEGGLLITMDLLSLNDQVSGHYYYFFEDDLAPAGWRRSNIIPLQGTWEDNIFRMSEFSNEKSVFLVNRIQADTLSGYWEQMEEGKRIGFYLTEHYPEGSLELDLHTIADSHPLITGKEKPRADLMMAILTPANRENISVSDSINRAIAEALGADQDALMHPEKLLTALRDEYFDSYIKSLEGIENMEESSSFNWEKKQSMYVVRNEGNILSLRFDNSVYTGGAHGITMTEFYNFDLKTGEMIQPDEVFIPGFESVLDSLLTGKLREVNGIRAEENLTDSGFFVETITHSNNFYINSHGIGFYYNVYSIAPFSAGISELFLTFEQLEHLLLRELSSWKTVNELNR